MSKQRQLCLAVDLTADPEKAASMFPSVRDPGFHPVGIMTWPALYFKERPAQSIRPYLCPQLEGKTQEEGGCWDSGAVVHGVYESSAP